MKKVEDTFKLNDGKGRKMPKISAAKTTKPERARGPTREDERICPESQGNKADAKNSCFNNANSIP